MVNWRKLGKILAVGLIGAVLITATLPGTAFAETDLAQEEDPANQEKGVGMGRFFDGLLYHVFDYQESMVGYLRRSLGSAEKAAGRAQQRVSELEMNGEDVSALEEALASVDDWIAEARQAQEVAEGLVDVHPGFDLDGRPVDLKEARQTVSALEANIQVVRKNIIEAGRIVRQAAQLFRET